MTEPKVQEEVEQKSEKLHRYFTRKQKWKCWNKASFIEGRDPSRWRYDVLGNPVLRALNGCRGPLCHEYDHITPYSKGGRTSVKNCQVLQTSVNRYKSNFFMDKDEMKDGVLDIKFSEQEMDIVEKAVYGDVRKYNNYNGT
mmetsp:Transcript_13859/g.20282  ORF Transcript_13859/g.20282 Transcript_13859/m.20282 type:complete len:141 (+) Transcript_13859:24-446(+)